MADIEFVKITLSRKQMDIDHPYKNEKNGKDYIRVFAPEGGVIFYPADGIKVSPEDNNKVYFSRPAGTDLTINYSKRVEGVPDDAPASEKYEPFDKTVTIDDLKEMYEDERRSFIENNSTFINYEVPSEWGRHFSGKEKECVSISVPIREDEGTHYYSFVVAADSFRDSKKNEGMSYFGFPRKKQDEDEDFIVTLKRSVKQADESYVDVVKEISSVELAEHIEAAKRMYNFVNVEISRKLIREFESKEGKQLVSVSVPVLDKEQGKEVFYQIVVSSERIRDTDNENVVRLSMFRKGSDGEDYIFHAKQSVLNDETQQYEELEREITSVEVARCFAESKERYKEQNATHSLGDEIRQRQNADKAAESESVKKNEQAVQNEAEMNGVRRNMRRGGR